MENVNIYEWGLISIEGSNCKIIINKDTTIGSAKFFCAESMTNIDIGRDCMVGRSITISSSDFHSILDQESGLRINPPNDVRIGDHVWVGKGVSTGKGAKIASDCILAEHCLIRDYTSQNIYGGIPARLIKEKFSWSREKISQ